MKKRLWIIVLSMILSVIMCPAVVEKIWAEDQDNEITTADGYKYKILDDKTIEITEYIGEETELEIPGQIDGKKVTGIGEYAFSNCEEIISIAIPDSVTSIGESAFYYCDSLESIAIPEGVTSIRYGVFYNCKVLEQVKLPKSLISIEKSAFNNCKYLAEIDIPEGVTSISDYAFFGCDSLENIVLPDSLKSIGSSVFGNCDSLTSITIPLGVTSIGEQAFGGCENLTTLNVDGRNTSYFSQDGLLFNKEKTVLLFCLVRKTGEIKIPEGVTSIGNRAFEECSGITGIIIPEGVTSIGDHAFERCYNAAYITIPKSVMNIGDSAFEFCESITSIEIPDGVTSIEYGTFSVCKNLKNISIPESVTQIGGYAFSSCENLEKIILPDGVTDIGEGAFGFCNRLSNINIPDSLTVIYHRVFVDCSSLTKVTIPDKVTTIIDFAFHGCSSLTEIRIPSSVTDLGYRAFRSCSSLQTINVDENNGSYLSENGILYDKNKTVLIICPEGKKGNIVVPDGILSIGDSAFEGCTGMTSLTIPISVAKTGYYTFYNCVGLKDVYYAGSKEDWGKIEINDEVKDDSNGNEYLLNAKFHYNYDYNDPIIPDTPDTPDIAAKPYITGALQSIDQTQNTITISGRLYSVSQDFSFDDLAGIIASSDNSVICTTKDGRITHLDRLSDVLQPKITITKQGDCITYQNGSYTTASQPVKTVISCETKGSYPLSAFDGISDIGIRADALELSVSDSGFTLTNRGWKENENKITIAPGSSYTYDSAVQVQNGHALPSAAAPAYTVKAAVHTSSGDASCELNMKALNLDYQRQLAEQKRNSRKEQPGITAARQELQNLCSNDSLQIGQGLKGVLQDGQIDAVKRYIYTWVAQINNTYTGKNGSEIQQNVMHRLGLNADSFTAGNKKAVTHIKAETAYGTKTIAVTWNYQIPANRGELIFGNMEYEILEKEGMPGSVPAKGRLGTADSSSMKKFVEQMSGISESRLKAIPEADKNYQTAAVFVTDKLIMDIVGPEYGSFADGIYTLFTQQVKKPVKKIKAECPVDIYVYDLDGNPCGSIVSNVINEDAADIAMYTDGDAKVLYLTGNDYSIKLAGNGFGTMTYTVEELDENLKNIRTVQFKELPLDNKTTYTGYVLEPLYIDSVSYSLEKNGLEMIQADTDTYQTAFKKVERISLSQSSTAMNLNGTLQLLAEVYPKDATNKNLLWSSDNEAAAVVDSSGLVRAVGTGQAKITVSSMDGSVQASCIVTVQKAGGSNGNGSLPGGSTNGGTSPGSSGSSPGSSGNPAGNGGSSSGSDVPAETPGGQMQVSLLYYIVAFEPNGGTKLSRRSMTLLKDDNLGILPKVQYKNYSFNGWYTEKSGGTKVSGTTVLNAATTLYAHWTKTAKPAKTKISALKSSKAGQAAVSVQKITGAKGYEIAYSTNKKFPSSSTKKTVSASTKKTLKKLRSGKKYYVKVRAYKLDSASQKVYGTYSTVKSVKVK